MWLDNIPRLRTKMDEETCGEVKTADLDKQTPAIKLWLVWFRKQLNDANLDFMENWADLDNGNYMTEFFIMTADRRNLAGRIALDFDTGDETVDLYLSTYEPDGESEVRDYDKLPLNPEGWDGSQKDYLDDFIIALADMVLD